MQSLPTDVLRNKVFPYLDSLDVLACRYTCVSLCKDTRNIPTYLNDATDRSTRYWRWLYSIVECWCMECEPMVQYMYWIVRLARYQTISGFFNSHKYRMIAKHCPDVLGRSMLAACARGDLRIAKIVRGATPKNVYPQYKVLAEAACYDKTDMFTWLVDMGDIPLPMDVQSFNVAIAIGENGNISMLRTLINRGFALELDHWWLVTIHALRQKHNHIMRVVYSYAPLTLYSRRFLLATITNDNPVAFKVYLQKSDEWPTIEDSTHLFLYGAKTVAVVWGNLDLPMLPHVRRWYINLHQS